MPSTFFGLTIGASGMNAFQAAINTTANNISNVETEGYSKQKVNLEAKSALRVFQKYGSTSTGVDAASVTRMRDQYYDDKYWTNQSYTGYYDKKLYYIEQIETLYTDSPEAPGFSTIFGDMFNSLNEVATNAGDPTKRNVLTSQAVKLTNYFNSSATQLQNLQTSINEEIKTTVDTINSIARKIALLNKQINTVEMESGHANDLRDARALLVDQLSEIVAIDVEEEKVANSNYPDMYTGATTFKIKINGQILVNTYNYNTLTTRTREEKYNQSDVDGLYDIIWTNSGSKLNVTGNNQIGSLRSL
ncbi:MAG: flagellar hook-associated protein FlgK, partial [Lachnospiraceae bacterium]|nr:flagellar hook-associated protein FlgK [Lachnospiraceae bacterium]